MFPVTVCTDTDFQGDSFKQHFLGDTFWNIQYRTQGPSEKPNAAESTGV